MAPTGAYTRVLVPGNALTQYQPLTFDRRWPKVPAAFATGTFGPFSSSVSIFEEATNSGLVFQLPGDSFMV